MSDLGKDPTAKRLQHLVDAGYPDARPVRGAVEGAVYLVGQGRVAKVWEHRHGSELLRMQRFYADSAGHLPFDAPRILAVQDIAGVPVTVEREPIGEPLAVKVRTDDPEVLPEAVDCLVRVLRALADAHDVDEVKRLPVLDEERPLWEGHTAFGTALADLIDRRVGRCSGLLSARVADFAGKRARLVERLRSLPATTPEAVVHGDVFPETVLVDEDLKPVALVDYGFLSTGGDPRFDAAVAAAIFPTSVEHAAEITRRLTERFADEFGYETDDLLLYRAAYAMATCDAFAPGGGDDHFAWCTSVLDDPAVCEVLAR
ncbi:aminoglycoside phosphotransferase family protein [Streptomyces sp. NPDC005731]|uniref:aminoglycoside phosphotransferase family protein n=1 Tax=Streptomyces sp. NPDC005731 TaxID=3157056 RepID=UPI0033DF4750